MCNLHMLFGQDASFVQVISTLCFLGHHLIFLCDSIVAIGNLELICFLYIPQCSIFEKNSWFFLDSILLSSLSCVFSLKFAFQPQPPIDYESVGSFEINLLQTFCVSKLLLFLIYSFSLRPCRLVHRASLILAMVTDVSGDRTVYSRTSELLKALNLRGQLKGKE